MQSLQLCIAVIIPASEGAARNEWKAGRTSESSQTFATEQPLRHPEKFRLDTIVISSLTCTIRPVRVGDAFSESYQRNCCVWSAVHSHLRAPMVIFSHRSLLLPRTFAGKNFSEKIVRNKAQLFHTAWCVLRVEVIHVKLLNHSSTRYRAAHRCRYAPHAGVPRRTVIPEIYSDSSGM